MESLESIAELYEAMGRDSSAEPIRRRVLDNHEEVLGLTHPRTMTSRARLITTLERLCHADEVAALKNQTFPEQAQTTAFEAEVSSTWLDSWAVTLLRSTVKFGDDLDNNMGAVANAPQVVVAEDASGFFGSKWCST